MLGTTALEQIGQILCVREVADQLGCSKAHVYKIINGQVHGVSPLPTIRIGRRMLVRLTALESWILENEFPKLQRLAG